MPQEPGKIRNVAVVGHRGTGKTSLVAWLKVHMGEPELAIAAIESSSFGADTALSTIYTPVHGQFAHGRGRPGGRNRQRPHA